MKKTIRKIISIICAIAILMSLCVVSMTETISAFQASDPSIGGTLLLDFENKKGVSDTNTQDMNNLYVADPSNPSNTVVKLYSATGAASNAEIGKADASTLDGSEAFTLSSNTKYKVSFKYKFAKGSYYGSDKMVMQLYRGVGSTTYGKKLVANGAYYIVDPTANPDTVAVGSDRQPAHVLAADTEWFTFTTTFTTPDFVNSDDKNDNLYINLPNSPATYPFGKMTVYIDDVMIDIVDGVKETVPLEYRTYDYKDSKTGVYYDPQDHNILSNNGVSHGNATRPSEDGYIFSVDRVNGPSTANEWRYKMYLYDADYDGFLRHEAGYTYIYTLHYTIIDLPAASDRPVIGIGRTDSTTTPPTTAQVLQYFKGGWRFHTQADIGKSFTISGVFECTEDKEGTYPAILSGGNTVMNVYLIEKIEVTIIDPSKVCAVSFNVGSGNKIEDTYYVRNTPTSALPVPTHEDPDIAFAGWYIDEACTVPVGEEFSDDTLSLYAKWSSDYSYITLNNSGEVDTVKLAKGTALPTPTRPNNRMFFEGWYSDLEFKNQVTTVPDHDTTLYAKYNYTLIGFNNGGYSDVTNSSTSIVTDPDDPDNKVLYIPSTYGATHNFELGNYDVENAMPFKMSKLNTTYYYEYKVKIPAGTINGGTAVYTGQQSLYSSEHIKTSTKIDFYFNAQSQDENSEWYTVSGYYNTGESWYHERVFWTVHKNIYILLTLGGSGSKTGGIYIDDVFFGEYSEEVPAGAVGVFYETNSTKIAPSFGYAGETLNMPEDPTLSAHEFVGWCSDPGLLVPFSGKVFPSETITLYAKWKPVPIYYDLNDFVTTNMSERYSHLEDEKGNKYLEYNYSHAQTDPVARARAVINDGTPYQVQPGATYTVKFKYCVKEVNIPGAIGAATHTRWGTWTNSTDQSGTYPYMVGEVGKGWLDGEFTFTASCASSDATSLSLTISGDAVVLIDDITVTSSGVTAANIYGSTIIYFVTGSDEGVDPVSGNPGDPIILPTATRAGFKFGGWYMDENHRDKFSQTVYGDESITLYARWALGKFSEGYEEFPYDAQHGISSVYEIYEEGNDKIDYNKDNVHEGKSSIFRDGTKNGTNSFTLCRDAGLTLGSGEQYTLTFYVKPETTTDAAGVISLIQMSSNTDVINPDTVNVITNVGSLTNGEWQKVTYTFTANQPYIGISTTQGNNIYFDNFTVTLKGYTGTSTGDETSNPIIAVLMVILAAGAIVITRKNAFGK